MAQHWIKMRGITTTPIVSKRRHFFHKLGVVTIQGRPRVVGKLKKGERRAPKTYRAWYGNIEFIVPENKLDEALAIDSIGRYTHEGMGQIIWKTVSKIKKPLHTSKKIRIRKKLPKLSDMQNKLICAMLLHDFVNTERHTSKIYTEVSIVDDDVYNLVKNHHNYDIDVRVLPLLSILQYYDRLSASISRKFRWTAFSRYRVVESENIDFDALKKEIELQQHSPYALYTFIRKCQDLNMINESLKFGFSSLKNHLLLIANLYLDDIQDGVLLANSD
ncbi:hypothetical protein [Candidatus Borrarchaeum sp.]|uniref:hypothetical protein n=1 Tax=Candidatus Borrarchaeum sp. TaxID=2846742 RepID=UPI00257F57D9|nr:hypothetical protein [Candidatus Borrarchaeum sp.]